MVEAAADMLDRPSCRIAIVTGAQVPEKMPVGENDGPLGSVVLAQALTRIGHTVTFYTDRAAAPPIEALVDWLGLKADIRTLDGDSTSQREIAEQLDIAIAVERLGGNPNGIIYGATGVSRADFRCNTDEIFLAAAALGKATLGIADGGNEIGCGRIREALLSRLPELNYADRTPCGGGIYSVVSTNALVVATSSNLGCSGVVAALALKREDVSLCHTPEAELALIARGVELGLTDGGSGEVVAAVDGVPGEDHAAAIGLMRAIVRRALATPYERGF